MRQPGERRPQGPLPLPDAETLADIRRLIADLPTYGYRRVHALLRREGEENGRAAPNPTHLPHHEVAWPAAATSFRSRRRTAA